MEGAHISAHSDGCAFGFLFSLLFFSLLFVQQGLLYFQEGLEGVGDEGAGVRREGGVVGHLLM